jgi:hypothetical protein
MHFFSPTPFFALKRSVVQFSAECTLRLPCITATSFGIIGGVLLYQLLAAIWTFCWLPRVLRHLGF